MTRHRGATGKTHSPQPPRRHDQPSLSNHIERDPPTLLSKRQRHFRMIQRAFTSCAVRAVVGPVQHIHVAAPTAGRISRQPTPPRGERRPGRSPRRISQILVSRHAGGFARISSAPSTAGKSAARASVLSRPEFTTPNPNETRPTCLALSASATQSEGGPATDRTSKARYTPRSWPSHPAPAPL